MQNTDWSFGIGDISLTLIGPAGWVAPFEQAWSSWASDSAGWHVHLVPDGTLAAPDGPFFGARPRFATGCCLLEAGGFAGEIAPGEERALLRAHPAAELADLVYFAHTVFALRAFDYGSLLLHAAGIVHREDAYAFFGHSGSGKTTAARMSRGKPVLSDDLVLLRPAGAGWEAWATPFGKRRGMGIHSAPLRALLRLVQAAEDRLEPMGRATALGELIANSPVVNADPGSSTALMDRWEDILRTAPVFGLHLSKSDAFWEVIDARFG